MPEKNIDEEIKRKHKEFDNDLKNYLKQLQTQGMGGQGIIQRLRQALISR